MLVGDLRSESLTVNHEKVTIGCQQRTSADAVFVIILMGNSLRYELSSRSLVERINLVDVVFLDRYVVVMRDRSDERSKETM